MADKWSSQSYFYLTTAFQSIPITSISCIFSCATPRTLEWRGNSKALTIQQWSCYFLDKIVSSPPACPISCPRATAALGWMSVAVEAQYWHSVRRPSTQADGRTRGCWSTNSPDESLLALETPQQPTPLMSSVSTLVAKLTHVPVNRNPAPLLPFLYRKGQIHDSRIDCQSDVSPTDLMLTWLLLRLPLYWKKVLVGLVHSPSIIWKWFYRTIECILKPLRWKLNKKKGIIEWSGRRVIRSCRTAHHFFPLPGLTIDVLQKTQVTDSVDCVNEHL